MGSLQITTCRRGIDGRQQLSALALARIEVRRDVWRLAHRVSASGCSNPAIELRAI
jgi:hypothetical protein